MPDFEYLEDHIGFFEAVYIFTDSGFAVVMIVPKEEGIDGRILALCTEFAVPASAELDSNGHPLNQSALCEYWIVCDYSKQNKICRSR